jgi:aspartokinase-like uncharacterized kinase
VRVEYSSEFARQVTIHLRAIEIVVKTLPTDHPYIVRGHNNFAGMVRAAVAAGQVGQLSDHPTTQAMLQTNKAKCQIINSKNPYQSV